MLKVDYEYEVHQMLLKDSYGEKGLG